MDKTSIKIIKDKYIYLRDKYPIVIFAVSFFTYFTILHLLTYPFINYSTDFYKLYAESSIDKYVNNHFGSSRQSRFEYNDSTDILSLYTVYYNKVNPDGTLIQKAISINMYTESYIPLIFLIALFLAENIALKSKLKRLFIALLILSTYLIFKITAITFDNFSYPEFAIYDFEGFMGNIIFYYNKLIKSTGNSINYIIVAIIWVILGKLVQDKFFNDIK